jgi:hypothetical protein
MCLRVLCVLFKRAPPSSRPLSVRASSHNSLRSRSAPRPRVGEAASEVWWMCVHVDLLLLLKRVEYLWFMSMPSLSYVSFVFFSFCHIICRLFVWCKQRSNTVLRPALNKTSTGLKVWWMLVDAAFLQVTSLYLSIYLYIYVCVQYLHHPGWSSPSCSSI